MRVARRGKAHAGDRLVLAKDLMLHSTVNFEMYSRARAYIPHDFLTNLHKYYPVIYNATYLVVDTSPLAYRRRLGIQPIRTSFLFVTFNRKN